MFNASVTGSLRIAALASAAIAVPALAAAAEPSYSLEVEAGPVWQSRNEVQIPNDEQGTRCRHRRDLQFRLVPRRRGVRPVPLLMPRPGGERP